MNSALIIALYIIAKYRCYYFFAQIIEYEFNSNKKPQEWEKPTLMYQWMLPVKILFQCSYFSCWALIPMILIFYSSVSESKDIKQF